MSRAALLFAPGRPLEICDVDVDPPRRAEVRVRVAASGVCHTDVSLAQVAGLPVPLVLGHEGAGVVLEVGPGVERVRPGDHVVLSAIAQCGRCYYCRRGQASLCELWATTPFGCQPDGTTRMMAGAVPVHQYSSLGTFAEEIVVPEASVIRIPVDMPLDLAALVGCAVVTGFGATQRAAAIQAGDTVVVIGAGGVGLNVVQGARLAGATAVVAIDIADWKLELATFFGATTVLRAGADVAEQVAEVTDGRGADVVFEAVGSTATLLDAIRVARRGGQVVMIGAPQRSSVVELDVREQILMRGLTITGCIYGSADVQVDFPRLVALYQTGRLLLDELVTARIPLEAINDAFDAVHAGTAARSIVTFDRA